MATIPASENQFLLFLFKNRIRRRIAVNPYQLYSTRVEPVTPTADAAFLEYVLRIPSELKLNHHLYLKMVRQHFPHLTGVPAVSGGALLSFGSARRLEQSWLSRTFSRIRSLLSAKRDGAEPIVRILQIRNFDRPFYHRRLLRFLFVFYGRGLTVLHPLFRAVCYIELWHLLFVDTKSPLRFNPRGLDVIREDQAETPGGRPAGVQAG